MVMQLFSKVFGTKNSRELKRMNRVVMRVNEFEAEIEKLTDLEILQKREAFRARLEANETLDNILPEAFAMVREAGRRALGMRIFDMQIVGGITLCEGRIAEMRTGEGKTLVATLALYLNAIDGRGVHLVTVNDYLAKWGSQWMKPLFDALGMTVGVVYAGQSPEEKATAYQADITYGTNNEFGFDYLRDNMAFSIEEKVQRPLNFAIVDEVDSILIDEARTPLIISGGAENSSEIYRKVNSIAPQLQQQIKTQDDIDNEVVPPGDYYVDEKQRDVELTEDGHQKVESLLIKHGLLQEGDSLYGTANLNLLHHVQSALKAHALFQKDVDYIVQGDEIIIVDEHTGRTMPGRRWSGGIHQAIEAKERVTITNESQTLASTTFQNYFRLYEKLSGMTGTADTEAFEFRQIYGLDVVVIPTNLPMIRADKNDLIYMTQEEKYLAIVDHIKELKASNAPVLVGTASIESSELLSALLKKAKIEHSVLNAKFHEKEAEIIAQAGRPGRVTIATNMAGRGTDIVLGGNWESEINGLDNPTNRQIEELKSSWNIRHEEVLAAGGLHVIGTERHESRRIDNQLRGRAGRQGDPGYSRFYLSLEDNLMRIFASERMKSLMQGINEEGEPIEHRMVTSSIERAQKKVEGRNFDMRKQLLEYDDVANDQRQMIYRQRNELMETDDVSETVNALWQDVINEVIDGFIPPQSLEEQWDIAGLEQALRTEFGVELAIGRWLESQEDLFEDPLRDRIQEEILARYEEKEKAVGPDIRLLEKRIMLDILDNLWKEHLAAMDYLRQGIHLRAYAQKQPKQEYKREAFELFEGLLDNVKIEVVRFLSRVEFRSDENAQALEDRRRAQQANNQLNFEKANSAGLGAEASEETAPQAKTPFIRGERKVGRNEVCPCGSGKKYKNCHGKLN
ncbi:MAG: preprotein translocase subunit SecA [Gammaproteobacteria bacterium]|jgi:preprotein translocase subunit SecA|nr:preprotein translocase subunit SecA [Gammaproteobacteria bacterium]MBT5204646.1 preprotein translocase subunit SecA [Gammaproteobacteria bacterium]MBT5603005.1 preprotein translocase subunit SecA [Gammaproteobacteria bacterium]MBT6243975.1 preprotein translocase subunit SecA [Gammaproteobacteria bacterium]